jgi:hypothetical protein
VADRCRRGVHPQLRGRPGLRVLRRAREALSGCTVAGGGHGQGHNQGTS